MKRRKEESKQNLDRWLLTYSDLITLLMVFFVVLYALSSMNSKKFQAIALSLSNAMGTGGQSVMNQPGASMAPGISGSSLVDDDGVSIDIKEQSDMEQVKKELQAYIDRNGLNGKITVNEEERGLVVSFQDVALFPLGSATLMMDARTKIDAIGLILMKMPQYIRVEGHTDNLPISTGQFPSNWELSVARATSVVQELIHAINFPPYRLSATGYGEFRPRAANDTDAQRQQNRRVDIVVLRSRFETAEPGSAVSQVSPEPSAGSLNQ